MKFIPFLAAGLIAATAFAHTDEYLDTQPTPNGGQMRMAGAWHYELVVARDSQAQQDRPVIVHVTDHAGAKVSTVGASGTATILSGKIRTTVTLSPDGDNRLRGAGKYASTPDMKVVVSVALPGKPAEQARFTPLAKAAASNMHAGH
jgi:hypothetical protein